MNTILVQQHDCKFIQNILSLSIENTQIIGNIFNNQLYRLYFTYKPKYIIFIASKLNHEILQFIEEYASNVKCYIYHDQDKSCDVSSGIMSLCTHLMHSTIDTQKNIKTIPTLINSVIFNNNVKTQNTRIPSIVCFINRLSSPIPEYLAKVLFPHTNLPIKMFHNPNIPHPQNLGITSEYDKADILKSHEYYLTLDKDHDDYINEAVACGTKVLTIDTVRSYQTAEPIHIDNKTLEYITFVKENIL